MSDAISQAEVEQLARAWHHALDVHAPIEELLAMLAPDGAQMIFPEGHRDGVEGFRTWYHDVTNRFFDEAHAVRSVELRPGGGDGTNVSVVVNWSARVWDPPEATSKWLGFDAYQSWVVTRGPAGGPVILKYVVDGLKPMEGSASL